MILIILGFLITIGLDLYTDQRRIKLNQKINHFRGWFLRLPLIIPPTIYYTKISWLSLSILLLQGVIYWILFDPLLNLLRQKSIDYLGQSTLSDSLFKTFYQQLLVKGILLTLAIIVTYYLS